MTFLGGRPARLNRRGRFAPLTLAIRQSYAFVQHADRSWDAVTTGWIYRVGDAAGRELFAYHWHPHGRSQVTRPHFHVYARTDPTEVGEAHYPTGPIGLADVARLLVDDFQVLPRRGDWQRILDASRV